MTFLESNYQQVFSRRSLLNRSGLGLGALGLSSLFQAGTSAQDLLAGPMAVREPHYPAKAKRVIHFFLNGGPSHVDTFDPKPALAEYADKTVPNLLPTERKTGVAFPSPFSFKRYGE